MDQRIRCTLVARWVCSQEANELAATLVRVERLGQRVSLLGGDAGVGFALDDGGLLGDSCELRLGEKLLLDHDVVCDLVNLRRHSEVAPLQLAFWRASVWHQPTSFPGPLLFASLLAER